MYEYKKKYKPFTHLHWKQKKEEKKKKEEEELNSQEKNHSGISFRKRKKKVCFPRMKGGPFLEY